MEDADVMVRLDPRSPSTYTERALIRMELEDYDRALADCDEALRLDPKDPVTHLVRGLVLAIGKGDVWHGLGEMLFHPILGGPIKVPTHWN